VSELPGKPDIVMVRRRIVIFVDGDFWHGRRWSQRKIRLAKGSNSSYWLAKIESNILRDRTVRRRLHHAGWHVVRVWESDIRRDAAGVAGRISKLVARLSTKRALAQRST
jgi:DNA mismatch endonuclease (patch repair protein)